MPQATGWHGKPGCTGMSARCILYWLARPSVCVPACLPPCLPVPAPVLGPAEAATCARGAAAKAGDGCAAAQAGTCCCQQGQAAAGAAGAHGACPVPTAIPGEDRSPAKQRCGVQCTACATSVPKCSHASCTAAALKGSWCSPLFCARHIVQCDPRLGWCAYGTCVADHAHGGVRPRTLPVAIRACLAGCWDTADTACCCHPHHTTTIPSCPAKLLQ